MKGRAVLSIITHGAVYVTKHPGPLCIYLSQVIKLKKQRPIDQKNLGGQALKE
jgi:hypothetical protein